MWRFKKNKKKRPIQIHFETVFRYLMFFVSFLSAVNSVFCGADGAAASTTTTTTTAAAAAATGHESSSIQKSGALFFSVSLLAFSYLMESTRFAKAK